MAYLYRDGKKWRLMVCKEGKRKDINLGTDYARAKVLRHSIEQAMEEEKFKSQLIEALKELGLLDKNGGFPPAKPSVTWEEAKKQLLEHLSIL